MDWNNPSHANQSGGAATPVSVLLAGPMNLTAAWYQALSMDSRFRVAAMANDPQDFQAKLASSPEVVLLHGTIFKGAGDLLEALPSVNGAVYLIIPPADEETMNALKSISSVKALLVGDVNLQELTGRMYGDALALRRAAPGLQPANAWGPGRGGVAVGGLRVIAVWSRGGGTGSTTLAGALALSVARRGFKTLLVGLGAPDVLPLHLGIKQEPNLLSWFSNPTQEGMAACIQRSGDLDVIAGFPDLVAEAQGDNEPEEGGSIAKLLTLAAYGGYAAILVDAPSGGPVAPRAVAAANTWVMAARPTVADVWNAVDAFRTVTQRAAGQHRILPGNIFVVLNQRSSGMLSPDEWHRAADAGCRKLGLNMGFPPVAITIPYANDIPLAQDAGRPALDASDDFARPIHRLADTLFGSAVGESQPDPGRTIKFGPLKVRMKK